MIRCKILLTRFSLLQAAKIQKAEDIGRTAWQKGATQEGNIKVSFASPKSSGSTLKFSCLALPSTPL